MAEGCWKRSEAAWVIPGPVDVGVMSKDSKELTRETCDV